MNFRRWGFKPAGDNGTFFQKIAYPREHRHGKDDVEIGGQKFAVRRRFFPCRGTGVRSSGQIVFAKDGWLVKSKNIDPYAGVESRAKSSCLFSPSFGPQTVTGQARRRHAGRSQRRNAASTGPTRCICQANGAAGGHRHRPAAIAGNWGNLRSFSAAARLPGKIAGRTRPRPAQTRRPFSFPKKSATRSLPANRATRRRDRRLRNEQNRKASKPATKTEHLWTQNVVAIWEGSDPVLKNEMVADRSALRPVGTNPKPPGADKICNGADDDGSGTVARSVDRRSSGTSAEAAETFDTFCLALRRGKRTVGQRVFQQIPDRRYQERHRPAQHRHDRPQPDPKTSSSAIRRKPCNKELSRRERDLRDRQGHDELDARPIVDGTNKGYLNLDLQHPVRRPEGHEPVLFPLGPFQLRGERHPDHVLVRRRPRGLSPAGRRAAKDRLQQDGKGRRGPYS